MLVRPTSSAAGMLVGHVARANPVWKEVPAGSEALAIFHGASHYISPRWYPSRGEQGKALPTWDYAVVHARGPIEWIDDRLWLQTLLDELIAVFERGNELPWHISEVPDESREALLAGIVGFEIPVATLQGKLKLNQKSPPEDRASIVDALNSLGSPAAASMAEAIGRAGRS
jgi:transcriptional regulator